MRFFGKIQIRILVSKNGFCVSLPKSENGPESGISDLKNPHSEWIHQIKSKSGFLELMIQMLLNVNANSEFTWTTTDTVLAYKLFVFHSRWILGQYERSTVLIYILRASNLSCHDKIILFRILRFFGVEESVWSGITNRSVQNADCRLQTADCRLQTGYKMQTRYKMQTADCRLGTKCRLTFETVFFGSFFYIISFYNLPVVMQSLFRCHIFHENSHYRRMILLHYSKYTF